MNGPDADSSHEKAAYGGLLGVVAGPLAGLQGTSVDRRGLSRVLLTVGSLPNGVFVEVDESQLELTDPHFDEDGQPVADRRQGCLKLTTSLSNGAILKGCKMRLLIADSDPAPADMYESLFSSEAYDVELAGDAIQCLIIARRRVPDILVLEYELPWGGGDGVLAHLREELSLTAIPVVLITRGYPVEELSDGLSPPVVGCLRRPYRPRELSEMVRSVTRHETPQDAGELL